MSLRVQKNRRVRAIKLLVSPEAARHFSMSQTSNSLETTCMMTPTLDKIAKEQAGKLIDQFLAEINKASIN